jgi:hypothetical protein
MKGNCQMLAQPTVQGEAAWAPLGVYLKDPQAILTRHDQGDVNAYPAVQHCRYGSILRFAQLHHRRFFFVRPRELAGISIAQGAVRSEQTLTLLSVTNMTA